MKIKLLIVLLASVFFVGCVTPPVNRLNLENIAIDDQKPEKNRLRIYAPEFQRTNGVIVEGDGMVVIFPDDKVMVVDGFWPGAQDQYCKFIKSLGIEKIDYLVATHSHGDHIGSFPYLINKLPVGILYCNGVAVTEKYYKNLEDAVAKKKIEKVVLHPDDRLEIGNCVIDVFGPILDEKQIHDAYHNPGKTAKLINSTSLVFKLTYDDVSILFTGDMYRQGMDKIMDRYGDKLQSTVLKVPHHGEWYTAVSDKFVHKVKARYAFFQDTRYVTSVTSAKLRSSKTQLLYRKTPGYLLLVSDGKDVLVKHRAFTY